MNPSHLLFKDDMHYIFGYIENFCNKMLGLVPSLHRNYVLLKIQIHGNEC